MAELQDSAEPRIRVLVVDDSAFMRRAIADLIRSDPGLEVIDTGVNGEEAVAKAKALKPDVITLDIEMPILDGLSALRRIRRECPEPRPAVLMCSSLTKAGSHEALRAMCAGAADVIAKEASAYSRHMDGMRDELIAKIKAIVASGRGRSRPLAAKPNTPAPASTLPDRFPVTLRGSMLDVIAIGVSTGGPPVLETILGRVPVTMPAPILIAQHMPPVFTKSLAERLDEHSALTVVEAEDGMALHTGVAYVGPGGKQLRVRRTPAGRLVAEVSTEPKGLLYHPCVNELFSSVGRLVGGRSLAIVLTGMGDDGRIGGAEIRARGGVVIAQSGPSCVVYGMPRAVVDGGIACAAMTPDQIGDALAQLAPPNAKGAAA